jgi:alkylation response protein AidB-like acyl-CoA dehydrogenase
VDFTFDEQQEELRSIARSFLADRAGSAQLREAMASELGYDPQLWKQLGAELGWTSVAIPETYGGLGLGYVELTALLEIMGAHLLASPFFASVCLAANALLEGGTEAQKQQHLPGIASGETRATLAWTEANGLWNADGIETTARRDGADFVLDGVKTYVLDGHSADLLVTAARRAGTRGDEGVSLFAIPADTAGVERRALPTVDQTRRQAEISFRSVRVPAAALLGAEGEGAGPHTRAPALGNGSVSSPAAVGSEPLRASVGDAAARAEATW